VVQRASVWGEESTQETRGHDPLLDAAELQRYPSWTRLLHQQPSGHGIQLVQVFVGQTRESGDTSADYLPCPEDRKACASVLCICKSPPLRFELAGWCQLWWVSGVVAVWKVSACYRLWLGGEEDAAGSPSAVQLSLAIRHQRIHVGEIDRKPGVISSAACAATRSSCQHPPRVRGWRRLTAVLSARGWEWVVCDRGRGVLPPLPASSAPPACAEQGGSSSPPPPPPSPQWRSASPCGRC